MKRKYFVVPRPHFVGKVLIDMEAKSQSVGRSFLGLFLMVYVLGIQLSVPVFIYQDVKEHDSFLRYIFVSPIVGVLKSPAWPYFAFRAMPSGKPKKIKNDSVSAYFQALEALAEANKSAGALAISDAPQKELARYEYWLQVTDRVLKSCDESELESIYPGWGKSTSFLKAGVRLALTSSERETAGKKDEMLRRFGVWASANMHNLGKVLKSYSVKRLPKSFKENEASLSGTILSKEDETLI